MLQDFFIEKLYTANKYIANMLSMYAWSHDLFNKYELHELKREEVLLCVNGRC